VSNDSNESKEKISNSSKVRPWSEARPPQAKRAVAGSSAKVFSEEKTARRLAEVNQGCGNGKKVALI